jgi:hypothetical protein
VNTKIELRRYQVSKNGPVKAYEVSNIIKKMEADCKTIVKNPYLNKLASNAVRPGSSRTRPPNIRPPSS